MTTPRANGNAGQALKERESGQREKHFKLDFGVFVAKKEEWRERRAEQHTSKERAQAIQRLFNDDRPLHRGVTCAVAVIVVVLVAVDSLTAVCVRACVQAREQALQSDGRLWCSVLRE